MRKLRYLRCWYIPPGVTELYTLLVYIFVMYNVLPQIADCTDYVNWMSLVLCAVQTQCDAQRTAYMCVTK